MKSHHLLNILFLLSSLAHAQTGNVGIGNVSPLALLHVGNGAAGPNGNAQVLLDGARFVPLAGNKPSIYHRHGVGLGLWGENAISFQVDGANTAVEAMRITNEGDVGIGHTAPAARLHVAGPTSSSAAYFTSAATSANLMPGIVRAEYIGSSNAQFVALYGRSVPSTSLPFGIGVRGQGGWVGVEGSAVGSSAGAMYGVRANGWNNGTAYGVYASAEDFNATGGTKYAVFGTASGGSVNWAGYFSGHVHINGGLSKASGTFKIDHPQDPENKYLYHSFVESPDMMNVYNGNIILDATGTATVELPDYFEALNKDFRYQLTPIGGPAQLYVMEEISGNHFRIAGGTAGLKVSWQVTGVRKDKWAEQNRVVPVVEKAPNEKGTYLHPAAWGLPEERGEDWKNHQEPMRAQESKTTEER